MGSNGRISPVVLAYLLLSEDDVSRFDKVLHSSEGEAS